MILSCVRCVNCQVLRVAVPSPSWTKDSVWKPPSIRSIVAFFCFGSGATVDYQKGLEGSWSTKHGQSLTISEAEVLCVCLTSYIMSNSFQHTLEFNSIIFTSLWQLHDPFLTSQHRLSDTFFFFCVKPPDQMTGMWLDFWLCLICSSFSVI